MGQEVERRPNPIVPLIDEDMTPGRHRSYQSVLRDGWNRKAGTWAPSSVIGRFLIDVRSGATPRGAARHMNIPPPTLAKWIAQGRTSATNTGYEADRQLHSDFVEALDRCEGAYEVELSGVVRRGAHDNPRLALDVLAKRFAEDGWEDLSKPAGATLTVTTIDLGVLMADQQVLDSAASVADRIAELEAGGATIIDTTVVEADGQPA